MNSQLRKANCQTLRREVDTNTELITVTREELSTITSELSITQSELSTTKKDLSLTQSELSTTKKDLSLTQSELSTTKKDLSLTQSELSTTKKELSITQSELSTTKKDLSLTQSELSTTKKDLSLTQSELSSIGGKLIQTTNELENSLNKLFQLENELSLMNETLQSIKQFSLCGNSDLSSVIANAVISSNPWLCYPSGTNAMVEPDGESYCYSRAGYYVYFDFRRTFNINVIRFKLYDWNSQIFTYSLDISNNRVDWTSLAAAVEGTSTEEYILEEPTRVRYIRMEGTNTLGANLILHSMSVDCVSV